MTIRHVLAHEGDRLKAIRLHALRADPAGFSSTYEREAALPQAWWTSRAALSEAGEEQRFFVAVDDEDHWVGTALARRDDRGEAVLNAMWVAPEARGQGAARALCDACAEWAAERRFASLEVEVFEDNAAGRRVYESAGFTGHGTNGRLLILRRPL
ncbi:MAG TPA: GNAT family N-acetyltransferase [Solirubrobacter sp.]